MEMDKEIRSCKEVYHECIKSGCVPRSMATYTFQARSPSDVEYNGICTFSYKQKERES